MKRVLFLFALIAFVVLVGCQSSPDGPSNAEFCERERQRFATIHEVLVNGCEQLDYSEHKVMEFRAKAVPREVWSSVKSISINGDETHYRADHVAHCHRNGTSKDGEQWYTGDICVKPQYTKDIVFWHEIAHAWHFELNTRGSNFDEEWHRVAGDVYGPDNFPEDNAFPSRGRLRAYSVKNHEEDVADTFMYIYAEVYGCNTPYDKFRSKGSVRPDLRYTEKVKLLWKYDFLTSEVYRKFTDLDLLRE